MAGLQIPTIQANPNEPQDHAPRIEAQGPDVVTPMAKQQNALEGFAESAVKVQNEIAFQHADTTATNARNDYLMWRKKKLYGDPETGDVGLINQKGDPTVLYKQFDKEQEEKLDSLSKAPGDANWSQMTQNIVNRRLSRTYEEGQLETLTQYGHQQKMFDDDATKSRIKLAQQGMALASAHIQPGDESSFGPMQSKIADIRNAVISQGIRDKTAAIDPNGEASYLGPDGKPQAVHLSDSLKAEISEKVGKGVSDALENLINSAGPDAPDALGKAKAFQEKFGSMLDEYGKGKLKAKMEKAETEQEANDLAHSLRGKTPEQVDKALADTPEATRRKALQYMSDEGRYMENLQKYQRDQNDALLVKKLQKFKIDNPAATVSDLEAKSWYKNLAPKISLQQDKAARDFMSPPKKSDPAAVTAAFKLLSGDDPNIHDLSKMTPDQAMKASAGLGNDPIGQRLKARIADAVMPTNTQKNQQFQHAMSSLKNTALSLHLVDADNDGGTDIRKGGAQAEKLNALQDEFAADLQKKGNLTYDQIKQEANDFVKDKLQNQPKGFFGRMFGGTTADNKTTTEKATQTQAQMIGKAVKDWQQETGNTRRPNKEELHKYMNDNKKRYQ